MIYRYKCPSCNKETERNVFITERNDQYCECGVLLNRVFEFPQICIPQKFATQYDDDRKFATSGSNLNHDWIPTK